MILVKFAKYFFIFILIVTTCVALKKAKLTVTTDDICKSYCARTNHKFIQSGFDLKTVEITCLCDSKLLEDEKLEKRIRVPQ